MGLISSYFKLNFFNEITVYTTNTVCLKKTSPMFLAITCQSIVGFSLYLAEILIIIIIIIINEND